MKILKNEEYPFGTKFKKNHCGLTEEVIRKMEEITICPATNKNEVYQFLIDKKIIDFGFSVFERFHAHGRHYEQGTEHTVKGMEYFHDDEHKRNLKIKFYQLCQHLMVKTSFIARSKAIEILESSKCNKEIMDAVKYWTSNFDREAKRQYIEMDHTVTKKVEEMSDEELMQIIESEK